MATSKSENPGNVDQGAIKAGAQAAVSDGSNKTADLPATGDAPAINQPTTGAATTGTAPTTQPASQPATTTPAPSQAAAAPSAEDVEAQLEAELEKSFGKGFVRAKKDDGSKTTFSKQAWELLGDNKEGWKKDVKKPQEVKDLEAGK